MKFFLEGLSYNTGVTDLILGILENEKLHKENVKIGLESAKMFAVMAKNNKTLVNLKLGSSSILLIVYKRQLLCIGTNCSFWRRI